MSSKYTKSARGQMCTVRLPGICSHDQKTVVFAHLNGGGWASKQSDIHGCYACDRCHFWLDGGYAQNNTRNERDLEHYRATLETQKIMIRSGVLVL